MLKFSDEEITLLSNAFEKRISQTEADFKSREKINKSAYNYYVVRYKKVLEKLRKGQEAILSKLEKNTIISCSNEALHYDTQNQQALLIILKKCGYN